MGFHQQGHITGGFRPRGLPTGGQDRWVPGERLSNNSFATSAVWVIQGGGWDIADGVATNLLTSGTAVSISNKLIQYFQPLRVAQPYRLTLDIDNTASARLSIAFVSSPTGTAEQIYSAIPASGVLTIDGTISSVDHDTIYLGALFTSGIILNSVSLVGL